MRPLLLLALALALASSAAGLTASNAVPSSRLGVQTVNYNTPAQKAQAFAPPECAPIRSSLTAIVYVGQNLSTNASELILGTPNDEAINALGGQDCVLGGGGNDRLSGGLGNDVLIGGPGFDRFGGGFGGDICYRRPGEPTTGCETVLNDPYDP